MINLTRLWTGTAQPADGLRYGHGSGAVGSARKRRPIVVWNIDTQGTVHPDQFWQDVILGNVKQTKFSEIWEEKHDPRAAHLREIRSIGLMSQEERKERMTGPCGECRWFSLCGGGFRTRAAFANGDLWGSDPGCYLCEEEISERAVV